MTRSLRLLGFLAAVVVTAAGCGSDEPKLVHVKGTVKFKGQPVPAGWISFTPDGSTPGYQVRVVQIKDGVYDSSLTPDGGVHPGPCTLRIAGFDGKKIPLYGQGKQIFNAFELKDTVPAEGWSKDFDVPASAAHNLKIEPTADN